MPSPALANIVDLARLSRLILLYHGAGMDGGGEGQQQAAALASSAGMADEIVVLFDAGSELPVPDLLAAIEAAVLETAPQAPLAPPMAGPVEALAFWQEALGMRFLLIMYRFDLALATPDPEFDAVLLKLVHDPLDASVLLVMDEAAAPLLQRLKDALPELGETFLRLPDAGAVALPMETPLMLDPAPSEEVAPTASVAFASPPPRFGPSPFLLDDPVDDLPRPTVQSGDAQPEGALIQSLGESPQERRSRRFSALLEQAGAAPGESDTPDASPPETLAPAAPVARTDPIAPLEIYPAAVPPADVVPVAPSSDGRTEPAFLPLPTAAAAMPAPPARVYRERRPMQVPAWMQKRRSRRRRDTVGFANRIGSSSTVLFLMLMVLAMLGWQMPQLVASTDASPRGATARHGPVARSHAVALRGNRYRLSISSAASSAGTGRDTR